jgi:hypothetical protein
MLALSGPLQAQPFLGFLGAPEYFQEPIRTCFSVPTDRWDPWPPVSRGEHEVRSALLIHTHLVVR